MSWRSGLHCQIWLLALVAVLLCDVAQARRKKKRARPNAKPAQVSAPVETTEATTEADPDSQVDGTVVRSESEVRARMQGIKGAYLMGEYARALQLADDLEKVDLDPQQRLGVLRYKAFVLLLTDKKEAAKETWRELLKLDPNYALSPSRVSPEFIEFFGKIKPASPGKQPEIITARDDDSKPPVAADKKELQLAAPKPLRGCGVMLCLVPGGVGQFANGHVVKGSIFAGLQVTALAVNLAMYFDRAGAANRLDVRRPSDGTKLVVQRVAFLSLFASIGLGILDAFLFY